MRRVSQLRFSILGVPHRVCWCCAIFTLSLIERLRHNSSACSDGYNPTASELSADREADVMKQSMGPNPRPLSSGTQFSFRD